MYVRVGVVLTLMFATAKSRLIKYFFFGNSITNDGYLRLAYLLGRFLVFLPLSLCATLVLGVYSLFRPVKIFMLRCERSKISFIVEDLEEMSRDDKINNIRNYAKILILHLIKQQAENRTTRSWDISIRNSALEIQSKNKRRKAGGYYLQPEELRLALGEAYEPALNAASLEVAEGIYDPETLGEMIDRTAILDLALTYIWP